MTSLRVKSLSVLTGALLLSACQSMHVSVKPLDAPLLASAAQTENGYYKQGKKYLASADYGLAIDAFRQSLALNDGDVMTLNGLGITYDMLGRFDLSQKYYEKALALDPGSAVTFSNVSYSQHLQGEYDNAVQLANMAKKLLDGETGEQVLSIKKIVTSNHKIAEHTEKAVALPLPQNKPKKYYAVERVTPQSWELVQKENIIPPKKPMMYKASFSFDPIFDRAKKEESVQKKSRLGSHHKYRILNGTGRPQMAKRMADFLDDNGLTVRSLANAKRFGHKKSTIRFSPGYEDEAQDIAKSLPVSVRLIEEKNLKAGVVFVMGNDLLAFDTSLYQGHIDI